MVGSLNQTIEKSNFSMYAKIFIPMPLNTDIFDNSGLIYAKINIDHNLIFLI